MWDECLFLRLREKIPRLRLRELLFLVVYAALIGQALLMSYSEQNCPIRMIPLADGGVFIGESDHQALPRNWGSGPVFQFSNSDPYAYGSLLDLWRDIGWPAEKAYHVVPEALVK